jgi:hypothetical protein
MDKLHNQLKAKLKGLTMITRSIVMRSSAGLVLLYKISEALDADMSWQMERSTNDMIAVWTDTKPGTVNITGTKPSNKLACPSKNDHRHLNIDRQITKHGAHDVGILHLGYWIPNQQNSLGVAVSSDSLKGNYGSRAYSQYQRDLQDFYQVSGSSG